MGLSMVLWIVQGLLAVILLFAGGLKLILPIEALSGPVALPGLFLRFIGAVEVLGAIGLILPWLLRIRPALTPLAAAGWSSSSCPARRRSRQWAARPRRR